MLQLSRTDWLVLHRISLARAAPENPDPIPDHLLTGEELIERFRHNKGLGTGGWTPYHSLVRLDQEATVDQLLRLSVKGAHAKNYNSKSLSIAVVGNPTKKPITEAQQRSLVRTVSELLPYRSGGLELEGHTNLPGDWGSKECPGQHLEVHPVATAARWVLPEGWQLWNQDTCHKYVKSKGWEI